MSDEVLRAILAEQGNINAERFIELMAKAFGSWNATAKAEASRFKRRGYGFGYQTGLAEASRRAYVMVNLYSGVKANAKPCGIPLATVPGEEKETANA